MKFTIFCKEYRAYRAVFSTPQELADWVTVGFANGHSAHRRFVVNCDYKPLYQETKETGVEFKVGDVFIFTTQVGRDNEVIALGPDGRTALFDRVSPLTHELAEGQRVRAEILIIGDRWMIVRPIEVLGPAPILDVGLATRA